MASIVLNKKNKCKVFVDKKAVSNSILFSLLSPLLIGVLIGLYYTLVSENANSKLFVSIIMTAISNAHIVGLSMGLGVLPGYLLLHKFNKINYGTILTISLLAGALFSYTFSAMGGMIFLVNTLMSLTAGGIFLFSLRKQIN
ncbi:hypothetical protein [Pseudoalteromonas denitrificans]|uniref:Uncharacterized protein n=1 Tax=Pseudoalteromonas denitrificans DSM 6059 TaxID=1123010 RepID=A0A1I1GA95_9GAMM|nr:hypothetical protein [Pseudoalteromonas denitrificans]SFC08471.1 hypothetical protein SAMN02745724_00874 [Pseudoalteromonas denitrificans DSM 6059]